MWDVEKKSWRIFFLNVKSWKRDSYTRTRQFYLRNFIFVFVLHFIFLFAASTIRCLFSYLLVSFCHIEFPELHWTEPLDETLVASSKYKQMLGFLILQYSPPTLWSTNWENFRDTHSHAHIKLVVVMLFYVFLFNDISRGCIAKQQLTQPHTLIQRQLHGEIVNIRSVFTNCRGVWEHRGEFEELISPDCDSISQMWVCSHSKQSIYVICQILCL